MNKTIWLFAGLLSMTLAVSATDIRIDMGSGYSLGLSSYFKESETAIPLADQTDIQRSRTRLGFSFRLGAAVPVWKKIFVAPAFGVTYGHKQNEYVPAGNTDDATTKNYYMRLFTSELNVGYDYLSLANGWDFYGLVGLTHQAMKGDKELLISNKNSIGWQAALGFRFQQVRRLGFQALTFYRASMEKPNLSYAGLVLSIFYRLTI